MKYVNKISVIEEESRNKENNQTNIRFTLFYKPVESSLEVKKYEHNFVVLDSELVHTNLTNLLNEMRTNNALKVFEQFYKDNFIKN